MSAIRDTNRREIGLIGLPEEVLALIAEYLYPTDVISLRQTCKNFHALTHNKSLWLSLCRQLNEGLRYPMPNDITYSTLVELTAADLENLALSLHLTNKHWQRVRGPPQQCDIAAFLPRPDYSHQGVWLISAMDVVSDRWLVVVYQGDAIEIWDLCPTSQNGKTGITQSWRSDLHNEAVCKVRYVSESPSRHGLSATAMDDSGTAIIVALSSHNITKVLLFDVSTEEGTVRLLSSFANPPHLYTLRAIHPASQTVVFSHGLTVFFVNWSSHRFYSVLPHDDDDELWTGPVGIAFLSSHHVLCVKTRSADVYTLSDVAEMTMNNDTLSSSKGLATLVDLGVRTVHKQSFPVQKATLRGVAFSEPYIDRSSHTDVCTASFLAYDVLHGLFHFEVQLILPPGIDTVRHPPQPPLPFDATCTLVAVRPMAQRFVTYEAISDDTSPPRTELALGSSAFISACALGTRGKRGVWTERQREHMSRAVYGFASADHCAVRSDTSRGEEDVGVVHPAPAEVHCKRLYEVQTYDLRDDLTHCAFSEVTGRIILGTRRGQVQFL